MKGSIKSKWVVGIAGTAFTAFVLSQLGVGGNEANVNSLNTDSLKIDSNVYAAMDDKEKELVQLDWSNFSINENNTDMGVRQSDRSTRRS